MDNKFKIGDLHNKFNNKTFSNKELYSFYLKHEPELKETTFRWRVYKLKNENLITNVSRGTYKLQNRPYYKEFKPEVANSTKKIYKSIVNQFPYTRVSIWETRWLANLMIHQPLNDLIIVEVDKEAMKPVFEFLYDNKNNVYVSPSKIEIEKYLLSGRNNIVVNNLTKEAPIQSNGAIMIPRIEKIIVDLFANKDLFIMYQGKELVNIIEELFKTYNINQSTLNRYATKRRVKNEIVEFLSLQTNIKSEKYVYLRGKR
ncbi:MAG: DUF6577 family protein [Sedimentibacter sp.]